MRRAARSTLVVLLLLVVLAVLLYRTRHAIRLEGFDWERLKESVRQASFPLLLLATALIFVSYGLRSARWVRFCRHLGGASFRGVYSCTLVGFTAIFLLGRAGEPVRPLLIARKERLGVASMFGIYVLERVFDMGCTVVLAGLGLFFLPRKLAGGREGTALLTTVRATGVLLLVVLLAAIAFLVYFRFRGAPRFEHGVARWRHASGWRARVAGLSAGFGDGLQAIRSPADLVAATGISLVHWSVIVLIYYAVAQAFGGGLARLDLLATALVLAFTMVGSTLQLPAVGGGSQLATFLAFTVIFGVEKEPAAAAAIVIWLITFAACSLAGIPLLVREGWSMAELRRLALAERQAEAAGGHIELAGSPPRTGEAPR